MKQLLLILIIIFTGIIHVSAQEKSQEEITWNIIAERFFNGDNSNIIRFEEDIEFELTTVVTPEDSAIIKVIISELNDLIETVDVRLADIHGNFTLALLTKNHRINERHKVNVNSKGIKTVHLDIIVEQITSRAERKRIYYYYITRNLVKFYKPKHLRTDYGGVFEANTFPHFTKLSDLDKDIIQKVYSKSFYNALKKNIIKNRGHLFYQNLIHRGWLKTIFPLIAIVLTILGFLILLSKETSRNSHQNIWNYLKKRIIIIIGIALIFCFFDFAYFIPVFRFMDFAFAIFTYFIEVFIYGIFTLILIYYSERLYLNRFSNFLQKQIFIFCTTTLFISFSLFFVSLPFVYLNSQHDSSPTNYLSALNFTRLFNAVIIAGLRVFYNFINYWIKGIVNQKDVEIAKMKELKNQAELNALHSRINPHFLYNSLNSIAALAHTNPDKTENMAIGLSELFRYSINKEDKTFVTVFEELEMVEKYLEIEKTRFGERLHYKLDVDDSVREKQIPKFLIQPIAENAIKHGLSKSKQTGKILIEVKPLDKDLIISIFDNGPDFPDEPVSGYGLQNLHDKLEIIYGENASVNWKNGENKHFQITLKNQF